MNEFARPCARCGCSSDWHSFKDELNEPLGRDVTHPDAIFSCNGPAFAGCALRCPDFVEGR